MGVVLPRVRSDTLRKRRAAPLDGEPHDFADDNGTDHAAQERVRAARAPGGRAVGES